jgi:hypothetical protein
MQLVASSGQDFPLVMLESAPILAAQLKCLLLSKAAGQMAVLGKSHRLDSARSGHSKFLTGKKKGYIEIL